MTLPLVYDPARDEFDELKGHGLAFGVDYSFDYEQFQRTLTPEQMILIGTEGIWEMRNESNEMSGKSRLKKIFRSNPTATTKEILVLIADALKKFRGSRQPEDDVTMVVIKILP